MPGVLINKYGHRIMTMVGGCIAGTGLVLSSYAPNMYYLIASFGVITGTTSVINLNVLFIVGNT